MANVPTFDPNRIAGSKAEARKSRAIADMFEPGSTNKTITAAAALSTASSPRRPRRSSQPLHYARRRPSATPTPTPPSS